MTEKESNYDNLEYMTVIELLTCINHEDQLVADVVKQAIPQMERLVHAAVPKLKKGGRLFYIGAGTSGRLGILDAAECPPTFGVSFDRIIGLIAGGDVAIRKAVEFAEDDPKQAWKTLSALHVGDQDIILGIAASGTTPYVVGGLEAANHAGITTACLVCNADTPLAKMAEFPIEVITGPEFLTGSTRMKAGTAQKMVLNMLSTSIMIQLGRVRGNKMVDMQLTNLKLTNRGVGIIMEETGVQYDEAYASLKKFGNVRLAITHLRNLDV